MFSDINENLTRLDELITCTLHRCLVTAAINKTNKYLINAKMFENLMKENSVLIQNGQF